MESEYLAAGFSLRIVARRSRKSFIVKMESENIKIDTEKIVTRVLEIPFDEFFSVEKQLIVTRSCLDIRQFGSTMIPADVLLRFLETDAVV